MVTGYINYPNARVTRHSNPNCGNIQSQRKIQQRRILINNTNLQGELQNFRNGFYRFAAVSAYNDMYVLIDLGNINLELQALNNIYQILSQNSKRFRNGTFHICC
jgi:hypothetical protein